MSENSFGFRTGYVLAAEVVGQKQHSFAEVAAIVSCYTLSECLGFLEEISKKHFWVMCHGGWKEHAPELDSFLSAYIPAHREKAAIETRNPAFVAPVSNHALICFALLACCRSQKSGPPRDDAEKVKQELFSALLSIQGRLFGDIPKPADFPKIFPELNRHVLIEQRLQRHWSCDMGRLHALLTVSDVEKRLKEKFHQASIDSFFQNAIGVSGKEFQVAANTTFGAVFHRADFGRLPTEAPEMARVILPLLKFVESSPDDLRTTAGAIESFQELAAKATLVLSRPAILHGGRYYVPCFDALFNRCLRDIPYLSRDSRQFSTNECSRWFGVMFEGYATWFVREILKNTRVELIGPYEFEGKEKDILLRFDDVAVALEVKSAIPLEQLQLNADWNGFVENLRVGTEQAFHAAMGVSQGKATNGGNPIRAPKLVIPVVLTFEAYPFRFPIAREFEKRMEWKLNTAVFHKQRSAIAPLQYLDIQELELLERLFDLDHEFKQVLEALVSRAYSDEDRHAPLTRLNGNVPLGTGGLMDRLVDESERLSSATLKQILSKP